MTLALKVHYRRIDLAHADRIPKKQAVILAANHPTPFIEPCILACFLESPLYFLVRGDMFKRPFYGKLLRGLHMLPVFRKQDGNYQNLKQNFDTFEACYRALGKQRTIMILAEGRCIHEKRLRPLQKLPARLAMGALEADPTLDEVLIIPVGVNYTHAEQARSEVMIRCGEPIKASAFREAYAQQPNVAITDLTDQLAEAMRNQVIHIADPADDRLQEDLLLLHRTDHPVGTQQTLTQQEGPLQGEITLVNKLNDMPTDRKEQLRHLSGEYFGRLGQLKLDDAAVAGRYHAAGKDTGRLLLGLPLAIVLGLWHVLPLVIGQLVASTRIKSIEFFSSVRLALWLGGYLFYTLIWLGVSLGTGAWWWALVPVVALGAFPWTLRFLERLHQWQQVWWVRQQTPHDMARLKEYRQQIKALLASE